MGCFFGNLRAAGSASAHTGHVEVERAPGGGEMKAGVVGASLVEKSCDVSPVSRRRGPREKARAELDDGRSSFSAKGGVVGSMQGLRSTRSHTRLG